MSRQHQRQIIKVLNSKIAKLKKKAKEAITYEQEKDALSQIKGIETALTVIINTT